MNNIKIINDPETIGKVFNHLFFLGGIPKDASIEMHVHYINKSEALGEQIDTTVFNMARMYNNYKLPFYLRPKIAIKYVDVDILFFINKELHKLEVKDVNLKIPSSPTPTTITSLFKIARLQYSTNKAPQKFETEIGYVAHVYGNQSTATIYRVKKTGINKYEIDKKIGKKWKSMISTTPRMKPIINKFESGDYTPDLETTKK